MSIERRIEALSSRHAKLDDKIHEEIKRPSADTLHLQDLKRQKLHLKEEILELKKTG